MLNSFYVYARVILIPSPQVFSQNGLLKHPGDLHSCQAGFRENKEVLSGESGRRGIAKYSYSLQPQNSHFPAMAS